MGRAEYEVGEIFRQGYESYKQGKNLPFQIKKVAKDIIECRTSKLGGHKLSCTQCGDEKICYNSCKNRHCPKCQFSKREQWVLDRKRDLLPTKYFHVIFTVPHELNGLHVKYPKVMYDLLFKSSWTAINDTVKEQYSSSTQLGMIAVLHSWGQTMSLHPHLHCIIPSGVYDKKENKWLGPKKQNLLCSIEQLTETFKATYIKGLNKLKRQSLISYNESEWQVLNSSIKDKVFNVNIQPPFIQPKHVIEYLGRYSHRVAITNSRIISVTETEVCFIYKDYRDNIEKQMNLAIEEFIRRFLQHILPYRYMKIRHYGLLSNKVKNETIDAILNLLETKRNAKEKFDVVTYLIKKLDEDISQCKICKNKDFLKEIIAKARSDPNHFMP